MIRRQQLEFKIEAASISAMRAAVNAENERMRRLRSAGQQDPALHLGAVFAAVAQTLRGAEIHVLQPRPVQRAEPDFTAAIHPGREYLGRMESVGGGVGHAIQRVRKAEAAEGALALRDPL